MVRSAVFLLAVLTVFIGRHARITVAADVSNAPQRVDFNFDIRPILSDRCYNCHGPDEENRMGGFRFDERKSAIGEADSGERPIVPGDPAASEMLRRITSDDPDVRMPPPEAKLSVSSDEVETLRRWIEQGAEWKPHWSFLPLEHATPTAESDWVRNPIDQFVLTRLKAEGLEPAPEADRATLIRRLSYDLTGLPPTPAEIDAFLADKSSDAYERLIDRLLASPRYGERMAVDWLDLARYADTYGYQEDRYRGMWPWRDWVVEALNDNLRYDEFITWQLAGDLLPEPTQDQRMATAFNRLHRTTSEGGSVEEEFRVEYVVDRVDTFGASMLGLTVGCARCHDHKYDPLSQKEYYQLSAFFNNIDESGLYPYFTSSLVTPFMMITTDEEKEKLAKLRKEVAAAEKKVDALRAQGRVGFEEWLANPAKRFGISGLIGDFSFDAIEDGRIVNHANPKRNGTLFENPQLVPGKRGNALKFSGENNFETLVGGQFTRNDPYTISIWVNTPDAKERAVLWHRSRAWIDAGTRGYQLVIEEGKISTSLIHFWPGDALYITTKEKLPVDEWVEVTVTYDGSSKASGLKIYFNGELQACDVIRDNLEHRIVYYEERNEVDQDQVENISHKLALAQRFRDLGFKNGKLDELKVYDRELTAEEVRLQHEGIRSIHPLLDKGNQRTAEETDQLYEYYLANHNASYVEGLTTLRKKRRELGIHVDSFKQIMVMEEMEPRRKTFLLERGAYDAPGEEVFADTPASLPPMADDLPRNRLGLARWLTDPSNPLASRVAVNRFWQSMFGDGLVSTPLDFGSQGTLPTHPELLDWLAQEFIDSGWDVKGLLKTIAMSATYRQSSDCSLELRARDPQNALLARGPKHRLSAEMIRDTALYVGDLLVEKLGGKPVKPYEPAGLWKEKGSATFTRDKGEGSRRRSLYTYWKRTSPQPAMMTLDAAKRDICVVQRQTTATPLQSLVLLNDPQYVEAARAFGEKLLLEGGDSVADQIRTGFRQVTGRTASDAELKILEALHREQLKYFANHPESAKEFLTVGDHRHAEGIDTNELASMTVVASALLNMNETVTKQ